MFFADPATVFANIGRALRPGGRLAFLCPGAMSRQDWYVVPIAALRPHEGPPGVHLRGEHWLVMATRR